MKEDKKEGKEFEFNINFRENCFLFLFKKYLLK